jgi:hypothetical protein
VLIPALHSNKAAGAVGAGSLFAPPRAAAMSGRSIRFSTPRAILLLAALALLLSTSAWSQTLTSTILGTVVDPQGSLIVVNSPNLARLCLRRLRKRQDRHLRRPCEVQSDPAL